MKKELIKEFCDRFNLSEQQWNTFLKEYEDNIPLRELSEKYKVNYNALRYLFYSLGFVNNSKASRIESVLSLQKELARENGQDYVITDEMEKELETVLNKNRQLVRSLTHARDENNSLRKMMRVSDREKTTQSEYNEAVSVALQGLLDKIEGKYQSSTMELNTLFNSDLLTMYPYTDLHIGMLALKEVSGYDFDLKIVEKWVLSSMEHLIQVAPNSETCLIAEMGDFLHAENDDNRTKSGHSLDVDTRHSKIIEVAFNLMINLVEKALTKHKYVKFLSVSGNHSENSSHYLKAVVKAYFKNEPRVEIIDSVALQQYYKFGKVLLGYHHGHTTRSSTKLVECMLEDNLSIISDTKFRYWHIGHLHSNNRFLAKEDAFCSIEVHKNLPPRDAWASGAGFRGNIGQVKAITYHKDYGEIGRNNWVVDMLGKNNDS